MERILADGFSATPPIAATTPTPYRGEDLEAPHIGMVFYDSVGDFAVATVVIDALRARFPTATVDYFGGRRTSELENASDLIDYAWPLFGAMDGLTTLPSAIQTRRMQAGPYDLVVNMESSHVAAIATTLLAPRYVVGRYYDHQLRAVHVAPPSGVDRLHQDNWADPALVTRYKSDLVTQHISEIWCRLCRVAPRTLTPIVPSHEPPTDVPAVLIATGARRPAKLWSVDGWCTALQAVSSSGFSIGLIGAAVDEQLSIYHCADLEHSLLERFSISDFRGCLTLPEVVGALRRARLCITIDNGIMHLAVGAGIQTIALFGGSAWRVWAPPVAHLRVILPSINSRCSLCGENRFRNSECLLEEHVCMNGIDAEAVARVIAATLADDGPSIT